MRAAALQAFADGGEAALRGDDGGATSHGRWSHSCATRSIPLAIPYRNTQGRARMTLRRTARRDGRAAAVARAVRGSPGPPGAVKRP